KAPGGPLLDGWDAAADPLPGAVQPAQPPAIPPVGLDLVTRRLGDQRRGDHLAAHVQAVQQPGQLEAGRSGLLAGSRGAGVAEAANEPADGGLVVGNPLDVWDLLVGRQDPDRDGVLVDIQAEMDRREVRDTGHGRLLRYGGSARPSVGDPRRCGPEPAAACWLRKWASKQAAVMSVFACSSRGDARPLPPRHGWLHQAWPGFGRHAGWLGVS